MYDSENQRVAITLYPPLYSAIGSFGDWQSDYDMTKDNNGIYSVTIPNVTAGTYSYKVRVNHEWSHQYNDQGECDGGSEGATAVVNEGESTVTIYFDPTTKKTSTTYPASSSGLQAGMIIIDGQLNGIWEGSLSNGTAVMIDPQEVGKQYTLTYYGSMPTGTSILMVDVNNMVADYPNLSLRLDAIQTDRTTVNFDNTKVRYGDIEDNGKYRMEIYNIYGNTNGNSPIVGSTAASGEAETLLAFNDSISVKFTLMENSPVVNAEPYAVLSDNNTVVTFYYDDQKTARGGVDINNSSLDASANSPYGTATTAVFDASFASYSPTSTACWFQKCSSLTSITGMENLKTENVTTMSSMFLNCSALTSLDVTGFNTQNVTYFGRMFEGCSSLTSLDVTGFKTEKATDMSGMFSYCSSLQSLDISSFNTQNVLSMWQMFTGCSGLTSLDLTSFNTEKVGNMLIMFSGCSNLTTIYVGTGWSTTNVANSDDMFTDCTSLVGGAGTAYDANYTDATYAHIDGGTANPGYFTDKNAPISTLEIYSVEKSATYVANQPINPTQSVIMTPGNDSEWKTDLAIGLTNTVTGESNDPLEFKASIYYPNSTETFSFLDALRGTLNPKDGDLTTNADTGETNNTGSAYIPGHKNLPKSGAYIIYEALQNGSLIIPIRVTADKSLFVVNADGSPVVDMQFKDAAGITQVFKVDPLCSVSSEYISGFISFNVQVGQKYYVFCNASKPRIAGYIFSPESITIDPATMANVKSILNAEPYAALSEDQTVVTFYYDDQKTARGGVDINNSVADSPYRTVTTAVIDASFAEYRPTSTAYWFAYCSSLTSITGMENLKTDNVTDMNSMFRRCSGLTTLDVSSFKTDNVTNMYGVFNGCSGLTTLDVSGFKTDNVTDMRYMFQACSSLTTLDLSGFNTSSVTFMSGMFSNCSGLTTLDLSGFNTDNVTDMSVMFFGCSGLTTLNMSGFKTDNATSIHSMFYGCSSLATLDVSGFNTGNVTNMNSMFRDCSSLTTLDVSGFNTANVTDMGNMFDSCRELTTVYVGDGWSTTNVTSSTGMFTACSKLVGGVGTAYDENHVDATYARIDKEGEPGYFTDKNAPQTTYFDGQTLTETIDGLLWHYRVISAQEKTCEIVHENGVYWSAIPNTTTGEVAIPGVINGFTVISIGDWALYQCSGITGTLVIPETVTKIGAHAFAHCSGYTGQLALPAGLQSIGTEAFRECSNLTGELNIPDNVTTIGEGAFSLCSGFTGPLVFPSNLQSLGAGAFNGCSGLTGSLTIPAVVTEIGSATFRGLTGMTGTLTLPEGLTFIGDYAFAESGFTGELKLPSTLQTIDGSAFSDCKGFTGQLVLPDGVNLAAGNSFSGCSGFIGELVIPEGTNLSNYGFDFNGCSGLTSVVLPSTLDHLGDYVFDKCTGLLKVTSNIKEPFTCSTSAFDPSNYENATLIVPDGTADAYRNTEAWSLFKNIREASSASEPEPYAVLSDNNTVVTFYYDDQKTARGGVDINNSHIGLDESSPYGTATVAVIDASFAEYRPTSTAYWFYDCSSLTTITGMENLKTDNVTDMTCMFDGCYSMMTIDMSRFNTENVTDMSRMFLSCFSLTSLDVSAFNTTNVTNMTSMFAGCSSLATLDVSAFNTVNVTSMASMFNGCQGLTSINVSGLITDNVTYMSSMFERCENLTTLDISGFNTAKVVTMGTMFYGCRSLTTIYAGSGWTTVAVGDGNGVFNRCVALVGGQGTAFDEYHTDYTYAHIDGGTANPGYFTDKNASAAVDAQFDGVVLAVGSNVTMTEALEAVGGREQVTATVAAIQWNSTAPLTESDLQGFDNPNLLIYLSNDTQGLAANRNNVVVNGTARNVVLTTTTSGNCDFYCPQAFTAERISYSRTFSQRTEIGVSRGWETLALPFAVQTVTHQTRGQITPFGDEASIYHFWLRRLKDNGFQSVQTIEANTPYILSMPNNSVYPEEYNLTGEVTFAAQNAVVPVTEPVKDETSEYIMAPTFQRLPVQDNIYVLNVGEARVGHVEGSIFERSYRAALPFEAYTEHRGSNPAPRFYMIGMPNDDGTTGIATVGVGSADADSWYDLQGRKLQGKPTKKGVYIVNGRKTVVK